MDQGEGAKKEMRICAEFIDSLSRGATADQSCLDSSSIEIVLEVCHIVLLPELEAATTTSPILVPDPVCFYIDLYSHCLLLCRSDH